MKKQLLKYINDLLGQSFSGWTLSAQGGYETALRSIQEKIKELKDSKPEYIYNVRRVYNSVGDIESFSAEVESNGWEVVKIHKISETSSYIIFVIRKEKE